MLSSYRVPRGPFGVVLNANAGRFSRRLAESVKAAAGEDHVFLTESEDHAREVLGRCLEREYRTVFAGGGDGTVIDAVNTLAGLGAWPGEGGPAVGVLRMGTGNALARHLGCTDPVKDVSDYAAGVIHRETPIRMVEAEGSVFPFAGLGHDAAVLNDYVEMKRRYAETALAPVFSKLTGYLVAGLGVTVPRYLRRSNPTVTLYNLGDAAWRAAPNGEEIGPHIPRGAVLYRGPCSMLGASTSPILGYGVRFFPHAERRPGRFHLRLINMSAWQSAVNFPAAARGTLDHPDCHDFYVERVRAVFDEAMPYQLGGDARGYRSEITFGLSRIPVTFVGRA